MRPSQEHLSIGTVARITGLSEFTLRAWERRYRALEPRRTPSGRRLYSSRTSKNSAFSIYSLLRATPSEISRPSPWPD
ncbi:MAG: MerR family DNA-binding transcriptional regulator [Calothrix sp. SM1_5_4]|nr:MerR family DNA-binding transcriptional regulator [Calothrix sp. SM1_5_4]